MKKYVFPTLLMACLLLQGCSLLPVPDLSRQEVSSGFVVSITVESLPANLEDCVVYRDVDKINAMLRYIESLELEKDYSNEPQSSGGANRRMVVSYPDGRSKTYYFADENYFRKGDGEWMCITGVNGPTLQEVLGANPSDGEQTQPSETI